MRDHLIISMALCAIVSAQTPQYVVPLMASSLHVPSMTACAHELLERDGQFIQIDNEENPPHSLLETVGAIVSSLILVSGSVLSQKEWQGARLP